MRETIKEGVFIAWRKIASRTRDLSRRLGLKLIFLRGFPPYIYETLKLPLDILSNAKIVFLQIPQGLLLFDGIMLKKIYDYFLVADVHTGFLLPDSYKLKVLNLQFKSLLRFVDLIIVHNYDIVNFISSELRDKVHVLYDPPINYFKWRGFGDYIIIPSSGHSDEPIDIVIRSIEKAGVFDRVYITGPHKPRKMKLGKISIIFTGFLPLDKYLELVSNCKLLIALSSREFSFLRAAWEALCSNTPFILSYTRTLRKIYSTLPVWAFIKTHSTDHITRSIVTAYRKYDELVQSISALRKKLIEHAERQLDELLKIVSTRIS